MRPSLLEPKPEVQPEQVQEESQTDIFERDLHSFEETRDKESQPDRFDDDVTEQPDDIKQDSVDENQDPCIDPVEANMKEVQPIFSTSKPATNMKQYQEFEENDDKSFNSDTERAWVEMRTKAPSSRYSHV